MERFRAFWRTTKSLFQHEQVFLIKQNLSQVGMFFKFGLKNSWVYAQSFSLRHIPRTISFSRMDLLIPKRSPFLIIQHLKALHYASLPQPRKFSHSLFTSDHSVHWVAHFQLTGKITSVYDWCMWCWIIIFNILLLSGSLTYISNIHNTIS